MDIEPNSWIIIRRGVWHTPGFVGARRAVPLRNKSPDGFCIVAMVKKNRDKKTGNRADPGFEEKLRRAGDGKQKIVDRRT